MTEKIEELEYFDPFVSMKDQCDNLLYFSNLSCNLDKQRQFFLYMACYDGKKDDCTQNNHSKCLADKTKATIKKEQFLKLNIKDKQELNRWLNGKYFTNLHISKYIQYTEQKAIKLNKQLKQLKNNIDEYIKNAEDSVNKVPDGKRSKRYEITEMPYIFYLQEAMQTLKIYNTTSRRLRKYFKNWSKIFNFKNNTELFNLQGYLGLLMMNEFCLYYNNNQLQKSIWCSMLMTNFCIDTPIYKKMEKEYLKELNKFLAKEQKTKADRSRAGSITKNEAFKQWCISFNEKKFPSHRQKALYLAEYYQEHYKEIIKEFPDTSLTQEDPYNSIYKWLQKGK